MNEYENHIMEAIQVALLSGLEDRLLTDAINAQLKLKAGILSSDDWASDDDVPIH